MKLRHHAINYDDFHANTRVQRRLITKNNFTYFNVTRFIERNLSEGCREILDYGCGVGTLSCYLASKQYTVIGTDVSPDAISVARKNAKKFNLKKVKFVNLNEFYKIHNIYDSVLCIEVIEHVPNPQKLLRYFYSLLRPGGKLFITTPSASAPLFRLGFLNKFDKRVGHLRRFSEPELSYLLSEVGFTIVRSEMKDGVLRNMLYTSNRLGWIIRFIRGPISPLVSFLDRLSVAIFGGSNIYVLCQKP